MVDSIQNPVEERSEGCWQKVKDCHEAVQGKIDEFFQVKEDITAQKTVKIEMLVFDWLE